MGRIKFGDNDAFQEVPGMRDSHPFQVCKKFIRDENLSFGAMGLLIALILETEKRDFVQKDLEKIFKRQHDVIIESYMAELIKNNYIKQLEDGSKQINLNHPNFSF